MNGLRLNKNDSVTKISITFIAIWHKENNVTTSDKNQLAERAIQIVFLQKFHWKTFKWPLFWLRKSIVLFDIIFSSNLWLLFYFQLILWWMSPEIVNRKSINAANVHHYMAVSLRVKYMDKTKAKFSIQKKTEKTEEKWLTFWPEWRIDVHNESTRL